jgi:hypothetical protein
MPLNEIIEPTHIEIRSVPDGTPSPLHARASVPVGWSGPTASVVKPVPEGFDRFEHRCQR